MVLGALLLVGALVFHLFTLSDPDPVMEGFIAYLGAMRVLIGLLTIGARAFGRWIIRRASRE
jgi:hypothetical protein